MDESTHGLTIPCHWNQDIIDDIIGSKNETDLQVVEVYGALADGGPVGHGRSSKSVAVVDNEDAIKYRQYLSEKNIGFTYLMNAPFRFNGDNEQYIKVRQYLEWVIGVLKPNALTIASHDLMHLVREIDKNISIHISTISGIKTAAEMQGYLDVHPNRIVPHHDVGKDWNNLEEIARVAHENGIGVEVLATESCLLQCKSREGHYSYLANSDQDVPFHLTCNAQKIVHPREFLMSGGMIRPEDVHIYEEMGVDYVKISGRSKPGAWLPEVVRAYQNRSYDGNLVRLLGIDPSLNAEKWIYIDNKSLEGYLEKYPHSSPYEEQVAYCDNVMINLYNNSKFYLEDGSEYEVMDNQLVLRDKGGEKTEAIINKEFYPKFR